MISAEYLELWGKDRYWEKLHVNQNILMERWGGDFIMEIKLLCVLICNFTTAYFLSLLWLSNQSKTASHLFLRTLFSPLLSSPLLPSSLLPSSLLSSPLFLQWILFMYVMLRAYVYMYACVYACPNTLIHYHIWQIQCSGQCVCVCPPLPLFLLISGNLSPVLFPLSGLPQANTFLTFSPIRIMKAYILSTPIH